MRLFLAIALVVLITVAAIVLLFFSNLLLYFGIRENDFELVLGALVLSVIVLILNAIAGVVRRRNS
jgi:hypothetical protein